MPTFLDGLDNEMNSTNLKLIHKLYKKEIVNFLKYYQQADDADAKEDMLMQFDSELFLAVEEMLKDQGKTHLSPNYILNFYAGWRGFDQPDNEDHFAFNAMIKHDFQKLAGEYTGSTTMEVVKYAINKAVKDFAEHWILADTTQKKQKILDDAEMEAYLIIKERTGLNNKESERLMMQYDVMRFVKEGLAQQEQAIHSSMPQSIQGLFGKKK